MSIIVIRGPERIGAVDRNPPIMNKDVLAALVDRAACAGKTISMRTCGNEHEFVRALQAAKSNGAEIALIDPGLCAGNPRVVEAMADLGLPFVEVHDDGCERPEPCFNNRIENRLAVANGFKAQSYTLALSIALEHLGCDECGCTFHVGT